MTTASKMILHLSYPVKILQYTLGTVLLKGEIGIKLKNILILVAHPNLGSSIANKALYSAVKDMNNVTAINIYSAPLTNEHYADKIKNANAIVFQFPFYWASAPSELKKMD